jgi:tRNA 2-thiouridine synthesizing protein A
MSQFSPLSFAQTSSLPGDEVLDLCGEVCPFTFVRTKLAMEAMPIGKRLYIVVDHEPAVRNIPRSAKEWGQQFVGIEELPHQRWAVVLIKLR